MDTSTNTSPLTRECRNCKTKWTIQLVTPSPFDVFMAEINKPCPFCTADISHILLVGEAPDGKNVKAMDALAGEFKPHRIVTVRDIEGNTNAAAVLEKEIGEMPPGTITRIEAVEFQHRVNDWMQACFGAEIAADGTERNHRFLEESLELVQACGCTASEAHQLVDYVYGRAVGDPAQELGGVMVTLAALATAAHLSVKDCAETELQRVWGKVEQIRAKQAAKPKHSPLPGPSLETMAGHINPEKERAAIHKNRELGFISPMEAARQEVAMYARDMDGTGSLHPCAKTDPGAVPLYRHPNVPVKFVSSMEESSLHPSPELVQAAVAVLANHLIVSGADTGEYELENEVDGKFTVTTILCEKKGHAKD